MPCYANLGEKARPKQFRVGFQTFKFSGLFYSLVIKGTTLLSHLSIVVIQEKFVRI